MKYYQTLITYNKYKLISIYNEIINNTDSDLLSIMKYYNDFKV